MMFSGDPGPDGAKGLQGLPGIHGEPGSRGPRGPTSLFNLTGTSGDPGEPGTISCNFFCSFKEFSLVHFVSITFCLNTFKTKWIMRVFI